MKLLWLSAGLLLPLDKGGKLRSWHLLRHLAAKHDVTYFSFDDQGSAEHRDGMRAVCNRLETIPRRETRKGTWRFYADAARYIFDSVPYAIAKYRSGAYRDRLTHLLQQERFDAVVCDFLVPFVNMPRPLPCPGVLFTHNVESEIWRRHAATQTNPVQRRLMRDQWRRMLRFESSALSAFNLVFAVSDADRQTFRRLYPDALRGGLQVVQTGVDTEYFAPGAGAAEERRSHLVFTGSMDWLPNEDGMIYFVREILPHIRAAEPETTLSIVGRAPTPAVRRLAQVDGVDVTGRVDDVRPHMAPAAVYIVPLRIGGGTRLKIFEAMSMGKAVVSTPVGAEGLPVTHGKHIALAGDPERFAQEVVRLIRSPAARHELGTAARNLVTDYYDWSAVADDFESGIARLAGFPRSSHSFTGPDRRKTRRDGLASANLREA
jgi:sugar transferase (PEP-CTERM/EpsH1 system associated)